MKNKYLVGTRIPFNQVPVGLCFTNGITNYLVCKRDSERMWYVYRFNDKWLCSYRRFDDVAAMQLVCAPAEFKHLGWRL